MSLYILRMYRDLVFQGGDTPKNITFCSIFAFSNAYKVTPPLNRGDKKRISDFIKNVATTEMIHYQLCSLSASRTSKYSSRTDQLE